MGVEAVEDAIEARVLDTIDPGHVGFRRDR